MTHNKKQKTLIIGIIFIILIALIGTLYVIKSNETPKALLLISEKDDPFANNIQSVSKKNKKHIVINRPETDQSNINEMIDEIEQDAITSLEEYKKSLVLDWNASNLFDQYVNFEISISFDQEPAQTFHYILHFDSLETLEVTSLFNKKSIETFNIENNGSLIFKETEITMGDQTFPQDKIPDVIIKDYGNIKPTPPPVVNKPKPEDKPVPGDGKKYVAFTFDDGPSKDYTLQILDTAAQYNAKVTFFTLGSQVEKFPDVAKSIVERGHQLASHSYNHPDLTKISKEDQAYQINTTENILRNTTGYTKNIMVRPPYGASNEQLLSHLPKTYMNWSNDPRDWESRNAQTICNNIINDTKPGDVILLHDIYDSTAQGFACGIKALAEQGYEFVTVEQLFANYGKTTQNGNIYRRP